MMNPDTKASFHRKYQGVLRDIAKRLGLKKGEYEVRSVKGGFGILGDVVLHTKRLYLCIGGATVEPGETPEYDDRWAFFRGCDEKDKYGAGMSWPNNWLSLVDFGDERRDATVEKLRAIQERP